MGHCIICGDNTQHPFAAAVEHFRFCDWEQREWVRGNFKAFGFWRGLTANICLLFPFVNTLVHWRYRKWSLDITQEETDTTIKP